MAKKVSKSVVGMRSRTRGKAGGAVKEGLPKISLHRAPDERAILHEQWPVEPECLAQGGAVCFRGLWEDHRHRVTREMEQQKGDQRNAEAHHQEPQQPA